MIGSLEVHQLKVFWYMAGAGRPNSGQKFQTAMATNRGMEYTDPGAAGESHPSAVIRRSRDDVWVKSQDHRSAMPELGYSHIPTNKSSLDWGRRTKSPL